MVGRRVKNTVTLFYEILFVLIQPFTMSDPVIFIIGGWREDLKLPYLIVPTLN